MISRSPLLEALNADTANVASGQAKIWSWDFSRSKWIGLSRSHYLAQVLALAERLRVLGVGFGDPILLILQSTLEFDLLEKAALHLGAIVAAVEPHSSEAHLRRVMAVVQARLVFSETMAPMDRGTDTRNSFVVRGDARWMALFANLDQETTLVRRGSDGDENSNEMTTFEDCPAYLVFTSGSTAEPKALCYTQRQMVGAALEILSHQGGFPGQHRVLSWLPLANLFQRMTNLAALLAGASLYFWSEPATVLKALRQVRPSLFIGVPRFYDKLRDGLECRFSFLPPFLRDRVVGMFVRRLFAKERTVLLSGSAPLSHRTAAFFGRCGLVVHEAYGLSECLLPVAMNTPQMFRPGTVGLPLAAVGFRLEADGEVVLQSAFLARLWIEGRYLSSVQGDLRTGDLGAVDERGFLSLKGRKSGIIKLSTGRRIQREQVEKAFKGPTGVDAFLVFGDKRPCLIGLIAPQPGVTVDRQTVKAIGEALERLNQRLSSYEAVRGCVVLRRPLAIERGELTPTLKVRAHQIEVIFAGALDAVADRMNGRPRLLEVFEFSAEAFGLVLGMPGDTER